MTQQRKNNKGFVLGITLPYEKCTVLFCFFLFFISGLSNTISNSFRHSTEPGCSQFHLAVNINIKQYENKFPFLNLKNNNHRSLLFALIEAEALHQ